MLFHSSNDFKYSLFYLFHALSLYFLAYFALFCRSHYIMLMSSSMLNVSFPNSSVLRFKTGVVFHLPSSSKVDYSMLFLYQAVLILIIGRISKPFQQFCITTASSQQPTIHSFNFGALCSFSNQRSVWYTELLTKWFII